MLKFIYMNYKCTYFEVDPMVIYKQSNPHLTQVVRLDDDYLLEFEDHLSKAWMILAEKKPLQDLVSYLMETCGQPESEAQTSIKEFAEVIVKEKLGKLITKNEDK